MLRGQRDTQLSLWLLTLYFLYPIPHTIALRNALLLGGLALSVWLLAKASPAFRTDWRTLSSFRISGIVLAVLSGWLCVQSSLLSPFADQALAHLRGDWLVVLGVAFSGLLATFATSGTGSRHLVNAISWSLIAHVVLLLLYQCWLWSTTGSYPIGQTPFAQKDYHSMLVTTLVALLLADLVGRSREGNPVLPLSTPVLSGLLVISFAAAVTLMARNAVIISLCMLIVAAAVAFFSRRHKRHWALPGFLALLIVVGTVSWAGLRSDERWVGFLDAAHVAMDTQHNLAWLDVTKYPLPLKADGEPVEESAYMRIAWASVAIEQIQRYPLGLGYGHKAFGWAVNRSYGVDSELQSCHSGLLDFTLANGIPGLLLWLALCAVLMHTGWQAFRRHQSTLGLMLVFTVLAYLIRCLLDGHLSGFRLEMYALLVGVLVASVSLERDT